MKFVAGLLFITSLIARAQTATPSFTQNLFDSRDAAVMTGCGVQAGGKDAAAPATGSQFVAPACLWGMMYPDSSVWTLVGYKALSVTTSGSPATGTATVPAGVAFCVGNGTTSCAVSGNMATLTSAAAGTFTFYAFHL